jgi:C4-dicarboxylate-specific signal transduction histidine kinase
MMDKLCHQQRVNLSTHLGLGLAHQINNPLSASVNYTQYCIKMLQDDEFDRNELLSVMSRACQESYRASEMIRRLRRFVSHPAPRLSTMNFNHAVLESVALLGPLLKENQIDLQLNLCEDLSLMIGDRIQLEQVVFNLILNAIQSLVDAQTPHPTIDLTTTQDNVTQTVALIVRDNGPGMDASTAARLFEPFFTTRSDCLGVGLALCRSICQTHGGTIQVRMTDQGACLVTVQLPLTQAQGGQPVNQTQENLSNVNRQGV